MYRAAPSEPPNVDTPLTMISLEDIIVVSGRKLNKKDAATLEKIFQEPPPGGILWADVLSLLHGLGAEITPGSYPARTRVVLNSVRAAFHEPYPDMPLGKPSVFQVRQLLEGGGIHP